MKDIQQLTLCCHTGSFEVYHSVQTKYVPKRQHFSYEAMVAPTQLSALDHNANIGRQHRKTTCLCIKRCQRRRTPVEDSLSKTYKGLGGKTNFREDKQRSSQSNVRCNYYQKKIWNPRRGVQSCTSPETSLANLGLLKRKSLQSTHQDFANT